MGQLILPSAGTVYVDTNALIYRVEAIDPYLGASAPLWDALDAGQQQVSTSELTLLEVLVMPLRVGNLHLAALYRNVLTGTAGLDCLPVSRTVLSGSVLFVTNDSGFRRVPGLNVAVLNEVVASP